MLKKILHRLRHRTRALSENVLLRPDSLWYSQLLRRLSLSLFGGQLSLYRKKSIGALWLSPSSHVKHAALFGISHNINHLGNVYAFHHSQLGISQKIEYQVIEWLKGLLHTQQQDNLEGYITAGGTESNLYLLWLGREYLRAKGVKDISLFSTSLTHYSVRKSAQILDISHSLTALNASTLVMDPPALYKTVDAFLNNNPQQGVLLCFTLGYSSTGGCDPVADLLLVIKKLHKKYPKAHFYTWIDASMQGLPLLFLDPDLKTSPPFSNQYVFGYCVDFHKFGGTPLPSGVVLYRSKLRRLVEHSIDYLFEKDNTLLGSRPGFAALCIWEQINSRSTSNWQRHFKYLQSQKNQWLQRCQTECPNVRVITHEHSLTLGLCLPKQVRLPPQMEEKYSLHKGKTECLLPSGEYLSLEHYKIHFSQPAVWDFLRELSYLLNPNRSIKVR